METRNEEHETNLFVIHILHSVQIQMMGGTHFLSFTRFDVVACAFYVSHHHVAQHTTYPFSLYMVCSIRFYMNGLQWWWFSIWHECSVCVCVAAAAEFCEQCRMRTATSTEIGVRKETWARKKEQNEQINNTINNKHKHILCISCERIWDNGKSPNQRRRQLQPGNITR